MKELEANQLKQDATIVMNYLALNILNQMQKQIY